MPQSIQPLSSAYRTALVTGASSGLGKAISQQLLDEGIQVYGTTRDIRRQGLDSRINWLAFEASKAQFVFDWVREKSKLLDEIDILVNNCGAGLFGDIVSQDLKQIDDNLQLLLGTPIALTKAALQKMRGGRGVIVNVSSLASQFPLPWMSGYTAGKAGLSAFTQSLMLTEAASGIVLIDFQPGDFRTAFNSNMKRAERLTDLEKQTWAQIDKLLQEAPMPDLGATDLLRALRRGKSGIVRSGGLFQTQIAPMGIRILPRRWLLAAIRRYYHLDT